MSDIRGKKTGNLSARSGLKLPTSQALKKDIQFGTKLYKVRHVIIKAEDVESKTIAHSLNTRTQSSLTMEAVRDIYDEVVREGVKQEGVAYLNPETKLYELFDSSRRRFCAIKAGKDLPLWVLDESPKPNEIKAYVDLTQKVKPFSWREQGKSYVAFAIQNDIDPNDYELLGKELGIGRETMRKKLQAASINERLISTFPDCEGVPTRFYSALAKIERLLKKHEFDVDQFVDEVEVFNVISSQDVELAQVQLLEHYQHTLDKMLAKPKKAEPRVENLVLFENRNKYARINVSSDGRKAKFEFGYLTKEELGDIETFVRERLTR